MVTMAGESFVKFTFIKIDPAWRRRTLDERTRDKVEFAAACANFAEDRFITDWEIRPGDRRAVHHLLLYLLAPKEVVEAQMKRQQQAMLNRMFGPKPAGAAANAPRPTPPFEMVTDPPAEPGAAVDALRSIRLFKPLTIKRIGGDWVAPDCVG